MKFGFTVISLSVSFAGHHLNVQLLLRMLSSVQITMLLVKGLLFTGLLKAAIHPGSYEFIE